MSKRTRQQMVTAVGPVPTEGPVSNNQPQTSSRNKGRDQEGTLVKQKRKYTRKVSKEPLLCSTQDDNVSEGEIEPLHVSSACMRHTSPSPERDVIATTSSGIREWSVREALGIVYACEQFRPYVIGNHFQVETDHESLKWLLNAQSPARLVRWALRLAEFDFTIVYKSGKNNGSADGLSRLPLKDKHVSPSDELDSYLLIAQKKVLEDVDLETEQLKDRQLIPVLQCLKSGDSGNIYNNYELINRVLHQKTNETFKQSRPVIPHHLRETVLKWHHNCDLAAHVGRDRTFECIAKRYFWPGMYTDVQCWTAACLKCINHKRLKPKHHGLLVPITSTYPFEIVSIDIIGPFKTTKHGYKYVLVMIDLFTSWVEAAPLRSLEAQETANVIFKEIITRHGCPTKILTDRGTQFTASLFDAFCKKLGIKHPKVSSLHPQTNGKCERFNRFLKASLATVINEGQTNWDLLLDCCLFAYRTSINTKVQETPFYLLYGRDVVLPSDLLFNVNKYDALDTTDEKFNYKFDLGFKLRQAYEKLVEKKNIQSEKYKAFYDRSHKKVVFELNDLVSVYWPAPAKGLSKKFLATWRGPYKVKKRLGEVTYRVEKGTVSLPVHVQRLRKYEPFKPTVLALQSKRCGDDHNEDVVT